MNEWSFCAEQLAVSEHAKKTATQSDARMRDHQPRDDAHQILLINPMQQRPLFVGLKRKPISAAIAHNTVFQYCSGLETRQHWQWAN